ncbi:MAG: hypothetical protein HY392_03420 [Candidatus Diapherotrites archaeon]|nr:hypothetical protein [Candidatus Diapherotrites archaeon]
MKKRNPLALGLAGFAGLFFIFFGILAIANSPSHAWQQFIAGWYWILPLTLGFGTQIGLYVWMQNRLLEKSLVGKEIAASGTVSGASMVACCAHHAADILPLAGLGAFALFFDKYQPAFIATGLFSNALGTIFMLKTAKKHNLLEGHQLFGWLQNTDLEQVFALTAIIGIGITLAMFALALVSP